MSKILIFNKCAVFFNIIWTKNLRIYKTGKANLTSFAKQNNAKQKCIVFILKKKNYESVDVNIISLRLTSQGYFPCVYVRFLKLMCKYIHTLFH